MATLKTTKGIGYFLDELFKKSKEFIYIVTPYIKVDPQLEERITDALDRGMKITLIYGKDRNQLKSLKFASRIDVYFYEKLHAKFYINEDNIMITSMNMLNYSEANNREIGVLFSKKDSSDMEVINECLEEFESIKKQSIPLNIRAENKSEITSKEINLNNKSEESTLKSKYFPIVKLIIADLLGVEESEIVPNARFVSDLGADSLDLVELVMAFEEEFNFEIPDEDAEKILSISQSIEYLELKRPNIVIKPKGFCIRTGVEIPFNLEKPMSYKAFKSWSKYSDSDYAEKYCHFSGEPSNGETSVSKPILKKNWKKAKETFNL